MTSLPDRAAGNSSAQSVVRAIDILFALSRSGRRMKAAELAAAVGLNRSTAYRLVRTLESCGLVRRDAVSGEFELSASVLELAGAYWTRIGDLRARATPVMEQLRDATGETVALHLREGTARIVIWQVESHHELRRTYARLGEPFPLHVGAPAIVILAYLQEPELESYLARVSEEWPAYPLQSKRRLLAELVRTRRDGYAISRGARVRGVVSIAAPILGHGGAVVGSINVSGPDARLTESRVKSFVGVTIEAAESIGTPP